MHARSTPTSLQGNAPFSTGGNGPYRLPPSSSSSSSSCLPRPCRNSCTTGLIAVMTPLVLSIIGYIVIIVRCNPGDAGFEFASNLWVRDSAETCGPNDASPACGGGTASCLSSTDVQRYTRFVAWLWFAAFALHALLPLVVFVDTVRKRWWLSIIFLSLTLTLIVVSLVLQLAGLIDAKCHYPTPQDPLSSLRSLDYTVGRPFKAQAADLILVLVVLVGAVVTQTTYGGKRDLLFDGDSGAEDDADLGGGGAVRPHSAARQHHDDSNQGVAMASIQDRDGGAIDAVARADGTSTPGALPLHDA